MLQAGRRGREVERGRMRVAWSAEVKMEHEITSQKPLPIWNLNMALILMTPAPKVPTSLTPHTHHHHPPPVGLLDDLMYS